MNIKPCPECDLVPEPEQQYDLNYYLVCSCFDPTPLDSLSSPVGPRFMGMGKSKDEAIEDWNKEVEENENL